MATPAQQSFLATALSMPVMKWTYRTTTSYLPLFDQKEQKEYIQGQINKIRNSVEDRTITNSMIDSKWNEQKEAHLKNKTKSCQPRRMNIEVERTLQESTWKLL